MGCVDGTHDQSVSNSLTVRMTAVSKSNGPYSNIIHIMLYYHILFKYIRRHLHLRKSARVSGSGIDMFCFAATIAWTVVFIPILSEITGKYMFQSLKTHRSLNLCLLHVQKKKKKKASGRETGYAAPACDLICIKL